MTVSPCVEGHLRKVIWLPILTVIRNVFTGLISRCLKSITSWLEFVLFLWNRRVLKVYKGSLLINFFFLWFIISLTVAKLIGGGIESIILLIFKLLEDKLAIIFVQAGYLINFLVNRTDYFGSCPGNVRILFRTLLIDLRVLTTLVFIKVRLDLVQWLMTHIFYCICYIWMSSNC